MGWPTTSEPRDNFVTVRLTDAEKAEVDAYVQHTGMNQSTAARDAMFTTIRAEMAGVSPTPTKTPKQGKGGKKS